MQLLISNEQNQVPVGEDLLALLERALQQVLDLEEYEGDPEVSLVLVDDLRMAELNRSYRGVEGTTDVLSFAMMEQDEAEPDTVPDEGELLLGDIVISVPKALAQAEEFGHSLQREMAFLAVHGMLHLLGYDHQTAEDEQKMRQRQREVMAMLGLGVGADA